MSVDAAEVTETTDAVDTENETDDESEEGGAGRKKDRDFTKFSKNQQELTDYINANSGLEPVTPNQVKAVLALKTDHANLPEIKAAREKRKAELAEARKQYEGLSPVQIKATKAAAREEARAAKLAERVEEARKKAEALKAAVAGNGEDLAALVESEQKKTEDAPAKRGIGRGRRKADATTDASA